MEVIECKDPQKFRELRLEAVKEEPFSFGSSWEEEILTDSREYAEEFYKSKKTYLVAMEDQGYVGMAVLCPEIKMKKRHRGTIQSVYVKKEFRGLKIAETLLKSLIQIAAERGLEQLELAVVADNIPAIHLYQKLGFITYGKEPRSILYKGQYVDQLLMYRKLKNENEKI